MDVIAQIATTAGAVVIPPADSDAVAIQPTFDHAVPESMLGFACAVGGNDGSGWILDEAVFVHTN